MQVVVCYVVLVCPCLQGGIEGTPSLAQCGLAPPGQHTRVENSPTKQYKHHKIQIHQARLAHR